MSGINPNNTVIAPGSSALRPNRIVDREYVLNLTGAMGFTGINAYNYMLPPAPHVVAQSNPHPVIVTKDERVCITFINYNSDAHPMHLHGHVFQVVELNGRLVDGAIRDTVLVPGGGCQSVKICFDAVNPGVHALHCHLEFHMMDGMRTTVQYVGQPQLGVTSTTTTCNSASVVMLDVRVWVLAVCGLTIVLLLGMGN